MIVYKYKNECMKRLLSVECEIIVRNMIFRLKCWIYCLRVQGQPRSTLSSSSAASDVYKEQEEEEEEEEEKEEEEEEEEEEEDEKKKKKKNIYTVSYTHSRAYETVLEPVCRLLPEKKNLTLASDHQSPLSPTMIDPLLLILVISII